MQKTIGNNNYNFKPLPAMRSIKVLTRLIHIFGPSISEMLAGMKTPKKGQKLTIADLDLKDIGGAIRTFASVLKDGDLEFLIENMLGPYVELDKGDRVVALNKDIVDLHFSGNVGELMKVLFFALQENFGNFLGDLGSFPSAA